MSLPNFLIIPPVPWKFTNPHVLLTRVASPGFLVLDEVALLGASPLRFGDVQALCEVL